LIHKGLSRIFKNIFLPNVASIGREIFLRCF
jgi:hypothetical protein